MYEQISFDFFDTKEKVKSIDGITFNISRWPEECEYKLTLTLEQIKEILIDLKSEIKPLTEFMNSTRHACTIFRIDGEIKTINNIIKLLHPLTLNVLKIDYKFKYRYVLCIIDMYRRKNKPFIQVEESIKYDHDKRLKKCKQKQSKLEQSIGENGITALAIKKDDSE